MNRLSWKTFQLFSRYILRKFLNDKRKELGLELIKDPNRYFTGKSRTLLAINQKLAPPSPDWQNRHNYRHDYTGYCFGHPEGELPRDLKDFIKQGNAPVYIGFGSVHIKDPEKFTDMVIEASQKSGKRIVLSKGWTGLGNKHYPENIFVIDDVNHALLFPKMAGVMHHGGSGTTHTGAKAGVPQFIMPEIIDQYYWGNRIYKMGLGPKPISSKKLTVEKLTRALKEITNDDYRKNAAELGERMKNENGVKEVVRIVTGK